MPTGFAGRPAPVTQPTRVVDDVGQPAIRDQSLMFSAPRRWRLALFVTTTLGVLGCYCAYIATYGVNVVYFDEYDWVPLVRASQQGTLTFSALWALHNSDRVLFPNLAAILLARLSHWNDFFFFGFSALVLAVGLALVLWVCRHEIARAPLWFIPVPLLIFTLGQSENILWAYQIAWFIVLTALIASLAILDAKQRLNVGWMSLAVAFAVVASYSSFQGLLVWPAGAVVLMSKGRGWKTCAAWLAIAAVVIVGYFHNYYSPLNHTAADYLHNAWPITKAVLLTIGNFVPNFHTAIDLGPIKWNMAPSFQITEVIGGIVMSWAIVDVVVWLARRRPGGIEAFAVALIVTGLGFDLLLIPGRLYGNIAGGLVSRYTTMNIPLYLGIYLTTIIWVRASAARLVWPVAISAASVLLVATQAYFATTNGITNGALTYAGRTTSADVLANAATAPIWLLEPYLYPPLNGLTADVATLRSEHMNVYEGSTAAHYQRLGIFPCCVRDQLVEPPLVANWMKRDNGAQIAWRTLSAVAVDFMSAGEQAAFYDGRSTVGEVWTIVSDAAAIGPTPATEITGGDQTGYPPPATAFLLLDSTYYKAWLSEQSWHAWRSVTPPEKIRALIDADPSASLAWSQLVGAYKNVPSLRSRFSLQHPTALLQWAATTGSSAGGQAELVPLHAQYVELLSRRSCCEGASG